MTVISEPIDILPPSDVGAEVATLGSLMLCGNQHEEISKILRLLTPSMFYTTQHATIFATICDLHAAGKALDAVILRSELERRNMLAEVGGTAAISEMLCSVPSHAHGAHYAGIVAGKARERDTIAVCGKLMNRLYQPIREETASTLIEHAIGELWKINNRGKGLEFWTLGGAAMELIEKRERGETEVVKTGLASFDEAYSGILTKGGYTIVAGRPSIGKSTLIRWLLSVLANQGMKCGLIAVEERKDKIAGNYLSAYSNILNHTVAGGNFNPREFDAVVRASASLAQLPIVCTDSALSVPDVMTAIELLATQHQCQVIAIDHIHLLSMNAENRNRELTRISEGLKHAFKRLGLVGIVAAQLSRPTEKKYPPAPTLTDLRESGALEEQCDACLMIHREDYYHKGEGPTKYTRTNLAEIGIQKNRNGQTGSVLLTAELQYQRFAEYLDPTNNDPFQD